MKPNKTYTEKQIIIIAFNSIYRYRSYRAVNIFRLGYKTNQCCTGTNCWFVLSHTKHTNALCGQNVEFLNVINIRMLRKSTFPFYLSLQIVMNTQTLRQPRMFKNSRVEWIWVNTEESLWHPYKDIHIFSEQGCNGIWNQFYSYQTPITAVYLFMTLFTQFTSNVIKVYFLCSVKGQATKDYDDCSQQSRRVRDRIQSGEHMNELGRMIFKGENRRIPRETFHSANLSISNHTWTGRGSNPGLLRDRPATNGLSEPGHSLRHVDW